MSDALNQTDSGAQALSEALRLSFRLLRGVMVLLALAYLASGIFVVEQHERALVLRFGRVTGLGQDRIKEPGLHWTWPRPFSEIVRIPAERVQGLESRSFWFAGEPDSPAGETLRPEQEGYVVTGDANLLHGKWSLRYTVTDPYAYRLGFSDSDLILRHELDRAVVHVSARFGVDRALRTDLEAYRDEVDRVLRGRVAALGLGVRIQGVDVLAITPPRQVAAAFDAVTESAQERSQSISDARAYAVRTINESEGEAARLRAEGETARRTRVSETQSRADAFSSLYAKWRTHPDIVVSTLWQDGVRRALTQAESLYLVHSRAEGQEIRLHLGPEQKLMAEELK